MATLSVKNAKKAYGKIEVLNDINLSVESGEFLILVGPSGCGKSTLMNLISGLENLTEGEIYIGDREVSKLSPKDRDIAMVFQSYALYPSMTVSQNIAFAMEIRKVPKVERQKVVQEVAETLQIEHLLDRKPSQLSGGQRQRVAIGRALARHPKIYLFDEPLSNLDAKLRVEMRTELKKLHQRLKTTIVYVTHDQIEAMTLADRIAVMKDGIIQQFDTPQEIYDNPVNIFVAGFMGSPAMNFLRCDVQQRNGVSGVVINNVAEQNHFLPLPKSNQEALSKRLGKEIILGIRPEQITQKQLSKMDNDQAVLFDAEIEILEPTGPDTLVYIKLNDQGINCRINPHRVVKVGETMELMMDVSKTVLFDPDTEQRIS
ncbi:MAG: ABC transporter ATP-binding protein [Ostreibacterium sp.]